MKRTFRSLLLFSFLVVSAIYTYSIIFEVESLNYWLKPFLMPLLAGYYVSITNKVDIKFLIALFFAFCGDLAFINQQEPFFILGMTCFLLFMLINMVMITSRIGEIKLAKLYIILLPFILIIMGLISLYFGDVGLMKLLFIIYGSVLGLYCAFALYWYLKDKNRWTMLNLIGVLLFFLAALAKGLMTKQEPKELFDLLNIIFYIGSLLLITFAFANHNKNGDKHLQRKRSIIDIDE